LEAEHTVFKKEVEDAFAKVHSSYEEIHKRLELHKNGLDRFSGWQIECQNAYNKMVPKITALEKRDSEKSDQIEVLLNEVAELRGMVESMRDKLCTCNDRKVIRQCLLAC